MTKIIIVLSVISNTHQLGNSIDPPRNPSMSAQWLCRWWIWAECCHQNIIVIDSICFSNLSMIALQLLDKIREKMLHLSWLTMRSDNGVHKRTAKIRASTGFWRFWTRTWSKQGPLVDKPYFPDTFILFHVEMACLEGLQNQDQLNEKCNRLSTSGSPVKTLVIPLDNAPHSVSS